MKKKLEIYFDEKHLQAALQLTNKNFDLWRKDGRNITDLIQMRVIQELQATPVPIKGGGKFLVANGEVYLFRALTNHGILLAPSKMAGVDCEGLWTNHGYCEWLKTFSAFLVADITKFPNVPVCEVSKDLMTVKNNHEVLITPKYTYSEFVAWMGM